MTRDSGCETCVDVVGPSWFSAPGVDIAVTHQGLLVRDPQQPREEPLVITATTLPALRTLAAANCLTLPEAVAVAVVTDGLRQVDRCLAAALVSELRGRMSHLATAALKHAMDVNNLVPQLVPTIAGGLTANNDTELYKALEQARALIAEQIVVTEQERRRHADDEPG